MILLLSTNLTLMLHISRLCVEEKAVWPQQSFPFPFPPFPLASVQFPLSRRRRQAKVYFEPVSLREVMWEMRMSEQGLKLGSNSSGRPRPTDWIWRVARESSHQRAKGKSLTRDSEWVGEFRTWTLKFVKKQGILWRDFLWNRNITTPTSQWKTFLNMFLYVTGSGGKILHGIKTDMQGNHSG